MKGGNVEMKSNILSRVIDTQGADVAAGVVKESREMRLSNKLSKEQTAALISGSNMSDYQVKQLALRAIRNWAKIHLQVHAKLHGHE